MTPPLPILPPFFSYYIIIYQATIQWILFQGKERRIRGLRSFLPAAPARNPGKRYEHEEF